MQGQLNKDTTTNKVDKIRRRSFDPDSQNKEKSKLLLEVEENVAKLHVDDGAESLTKETKKRRKSLSKANDGGMKFYDQEDRDQKAEMKERAKQYGNVAQTISKADDGLAKIGKKVMKSFKEALQAERSSLIFIDRNRNEMVSY